MRTQLITGILAIALISQVKAADPETLRQGAWCEVTRRPVEKSALGAEDKQALEIFRQWYAASGRTLAEKSLRGDMLTEEEQPYEWPARAGYMYEAFSNGDLKRNPDPADRPAQYVQSSVTNGKELMRKGFSGESLSGEELRKLRDYRMYTEMKRTRAYVLPFEFGFTVPSVKPGSEAPDFPLISLEEILQSPDYSDTVRPDRTAFLKPEGLEKFTRLFEGYHSNGTGIEPEPFNQADGKPMLSSLRGKKPVVLIFANASDVFWRVCLPTLEPLVQALGDKVQFYFVNISYHDTFSGGYEFYGDKAGGLTVNFWSSVPEERARQAKIQYMVNPNATLDCLIDDPYARIRNLYGSEGGSANYYLIDLDGRIVFQSSSGWFYWTNGPYPDSILWLNDMERAVHALLARGGRMDKNSVAESSAKTESSRPFFKTRKAKNYGGEIKNALWFTGTVTAVDPEKKTVDVQAARLNPEAMKGWRFIQQDRSRIKLPSIVQPFIPQLEKWIQSGETGKTYTFQLGDDVELFLNGQEAEPADFKPGDRIGAKFAPAGEGNNVITPEHFRATRL
jgi:hypothetical protein